MLKTILSFLLGGALAASAVPAENPPLLQAGARAVINLNGTWETHSNQALACNFPPPQDGWKQDKVPHEKAALLKGNEIWWNYGHPVAELKKKGLTNFDSRNDISAWYRRSFTLPAKAEEKTVTLTFESIVCKNVVWVNGTKVGESIVGSGPTTYDITSAVHWGGNNEIVVWLAGPDALIDLQNDLYIGSSVNAGGITSNVRVELKSPVHIDDVYVKTSVAKKRLEIEMTLANNGKVPANIVPSSMIARASTGEPEIEVSGEPVTLAAGEQKTVTLARDWQDPVLWSPATPFLYVAGCRLASSQGATLDTYSQRFGFREFTIKGREFFLNGKPFTLFRDNADGNPRNNYEALYGKEDPLRGLPLKNLAGSRFNNFRVWGSNPLVAQMADEIGVTVAPSLAVYWPEIYPLDKQSFWLPNMKEHLRKVVKNWRNHPSVIIWNMGNESYWGNVPNNPVMKQVCKELVETVRALDNTRPLDGDAEVAWDGLLDIVSIHYPGAPGDLSKQYPNSGVVVPNDLYWLKEKDNAGWRGSFDWDRPLSVGEYSMTPAGPDAVSGFAGERAYNWITESTHPTDDLFVNLMTKVSDVYRVQGVACINPWDNTEQTARIIPRFAIHPLDFHPNFQAGGTAPRKFAVFYESDFQLPKSRLECFLAVDGRKVWETTIPVKLKRGTNVFDVSVTSPQVGKITKAELTVRLLYDFSGFTPERMTHSENVYLLPESSLADVDAKKIALLDPSGQTAEALSGLRLTLSPLKSIDAAALAGKKLLLVAGDAPIAPAKETLLAFAKKGGSVVFLQRADAENLGIGYPEIDKRQVASRAWKRIHTHPVTDGLDEAQFSYWRPDNLVGKLNYVKPFEGDYRTILDAGGLRGLEWAPLCETALGNGHLVFSQLSLVDRLNVEPLAAEMLSRIVHYGLAAAPAKTHPLRLLAQNKTLEEILKQCRVPFTKGLEGNGPVLWDGSYAPSPKEIAKLKAHLAAGGKLWLHGFTPENVAATAAILPFKPELAPLDAKFTTAVRISDSPLMDNLSSADFLWAKLDLWHRGGYLAGSSATTKLGAHVLRLPALDAGTPLVEPGLLVGIAAGKGEILFDTLAWETASNVETERVTRIVSSLAMNLGAAVNKIEGDAYDYFPVDLAKTANMGFVDDVADDGQGGWLDMGQFDLCFFLTNHTERLNGTGAPIAVEPFPENTRFCGVPFKLTAPKKNDGKSVIALRSHSRGVKLPEKAEGIVVDHKADKLWFIHGANYVPKDKGVVIAKYVIHYEDGTSVDFPIRKGIEINDWSGPLKPDSAKICWTGNNRGGTSFGLFLTEWTNPNPAKPIKSIDVIGNLTDAQIGVVGIAGGVAKPEAQKAAK